MKLLANCLLAIALIFRAAPLCASSVNADAVTAMPGCEDAAGHHDNKQGEKREDAARACHAYISPAVASSVFTHPMLPTAVLNINTATRFAGRLAEPPTPPPRLASANNIQQFNGAIS